MLHLIESINISWPSDKLIQTNKFLHTKVPLTQNTTVSWMTFHLLLDSVFIKITFIVESALHIGIITITRINSSCSTRCQGDKKYRSQTIGDLI